MSDFDKFFKDKLEEEQSFPRRSKNWKSVSKRLDAFDAGGHMGHSYLKYWKIAAVAASLTIGVLAWKVADLHQDKKELQHQLNEIASVQSKSETAPPESEAQRLTSETPITANEPVKDDAKAMEGNPEIQTEKQDNGAERFKKESDGGRVVSERKTVRNQTSDPKTPEQRMQRSQSDAVATNTAKAPQQTTEKPVNNPAAQKSDNIAENAPTTVQAPDVNSENAEKPAVSETTQKPDDAVTNSISQQDNTSTIAQTSTSDSAQQQPASTPETKNTVGIPTPANGQDSASVVKAPATQPLQSVENQQEKTADAAPKEEILKPARTYDRLKAGAQFVLGSPVPAETGVSLLKGQGITAAFRFWNNFSMTASADWVRFDINTTKFVQRFHPHHPEPGPGHGWPGGPGQQDELKLVQVEGTQRQRQLSLGLEYAIPVRFWVRPTVQIAHTWVNVEPQLLSFKFEEEHQGGPGGGHDEPKYFVEKTDRQRLTKIWRAGFAFQRDTPRWVFSVGADYVKDFSSSDALFNSVQLKAGLQYKIL